LGEGGGARAPNKTFPLITHLQPLCLTLSIG
jgi:hypothetical protein